VDPLAHDFPSSSSSSSRQLARCGKPREASRTPITRKRRHEPAGPPSVPLFHQPPHPTALSHPPSFWDTGLVCGWSPNSRSPSGQLAAGLPFSGASARDKRERVGGRDAGTAGLEDWGPTRPREEEVEGDFTSRARRDNRSGSYTHTRIHSCMPRGRTYRRASPPGKQTRAQLGPGRSVAVLRLDPEKKRRQR
jgi:hypothetical protein